VGHDGNLWFTENGLSRVARITLGGEVTEFSAGITPGSEPRGITAGPDGNVWFTEEVGNRIGRITPAGVVTEFPTGRPGSFGALSIAAGPDGDLWYTGGNHIGRVSLDPSVDTGAASAVGATSATVAGSVTPFSLATSYAFEYGRSTAYGASTAPRTLTPSVTPRAVTGSLAGLEPGTRYHYRLVASSAAGTSRGPDRTFTTAAAGAMPRAGGDAPGATRPGATRGAGARADRRGPRMALLRRRLTVDSAGRVRVALRCPLAEPLGCRGTVRLLAGRRSVRIGSAGFRAGGGQARTVALRVSRRGRALLRAARRVRARVVVTARDAAGNRTRTAVRVTLRAARR